MLNTGNCGMKRRSWLSQKVLSILCLKLSEKNKTVKEKRNTEIKIAGRCPIQGVFRRSFSFSGHLANASAWKGSCQFLELSRTPLCCAVSRNHRLANADELSILHLEINILQYKLRLPVHNVKGLMQILNYCPHNHTPKVKRKRRKACNRFAPLQILIFLRCSHYKGITNEGQ